MKKIFKDSERLFVLIVSVFITVLFVWDYALAPFTELTNAIIVNGATVLSALIVALILTRITFYFHPQERPFLVWAAFALGMWLWAIAEGVWGYLYTTVGEVPLFSFADVLWFMGYIALTVSIVRQYRLVFFEQKYTIGWAAIGIWLATLLSIETILLLTHSEAPVVDFFRYFYVIADTMVGLSAGYLVYAFRGRTLAIPWLTISSFVVTDIIYIRLTETGAYDWVMSGVSIALVADTLYLVAYLIVAWGVLGQYILLKTSSDRSQT
jgi:hypothetical protein